VPAILSAAKSKDPYALKPVTEKTDPATHFARSGWQLLGWGAGRRPAPSRFMPVILCLTQGVAIGCQPMPHCGRETSPGPYGPPSPKGNVINLRKLPTCLPPSDEGGARRAEGEKTPNFPFSSHRGRNLSVFSPSVAARQLPHQREPSFTQPPKDLKLMTLPQRGGHLSRAFYGNGG